jgi:hypothetical protein
MQTSAGRLRPAPTPATLATSCGWYWVCSSLLVQERVGGCDLTDLGSGRLQEARLAGLRAARIAHRELGLASVMRHEDGQA